MDVDKLIIVFAKKIIFNLMRQLYAAVSVERNLLRVSKKAYPQLLGDELGYRVSNQAISGTMIKDGLKDRPGMDKSY